MAIGTAYMSADGGSGKKKKTFDWEAYQKQQQLENMMASQSSANKTPSTYNSGGSGTSGGSSSSSTSTEYSGGGSSFDLAAYMAELQRQKQARADEAYERNMARIAEAYGAAAGSLNDNYNSTVGRLNQAKDKSMNDVNYDAEKSLRQAYINKMLSERNMNQRLSAMGYNGGATESTMAQLANQYGNSRNGINETRNGNISDLNMTYADNLAAALQSYNSAKANLDLQRMQMEIEAENARQNALDTAIAGSMNIDGSYYSALQAALDNQAAYTYDPSAATNDYVAGNVTQAQSGADSTNYAKYLEQAKLQAAQGNTVGSIRDSLFGAVNSGQIDINTLYSILKQLGAA